MKEIPKKSKEEIEQIIRSTFTNNGDEITSMVVGFRDDSPYSFVAFKDQFHAQHALDSFREKDIF